MKNKLTKGMLVLIMSFLALQINAQTTNYGHDGNRPQSSSIDHVNNEITKGTKNVWFYEDFSDGIAAWTTMGAGAENWGENPGNTAGGEAPEARMSYSPIFDDYGSLVSPVISTSGETTVALSFLQFLDNYSGGFTILVQTTSDGGANWNTIWEKNIADDANYAAFENVIINNSDVGSENFQFAFTFIGNSDLVDGWSIDNVTLSTSSAADVSPLSLSGIYVPIYADDALVVGSIVGNLGTSLATFDVLLEISDNDGVVFTSTKTLTDLASGEQINVDFDTWTTVEGDYTVTVTTLLSDDENPDNDIINDAFVVLASDYYCIPSGDCSYADGITGFIFAGIENTESGCSTNGYGNFTSMQATVEIGQIYTMSISTGWATNDASIWVDFNKDMVFSENELILIDEPLIADEFIDVSVHIPGYFQPGLTYMRIAGAYGGGSSEDPCAALNYGEFEDYSIEITGTPIDYDAIAFSINVDPIIEAGDIVPTATVKNGGSNIISFPVTFETNDGYSSTVTVTDLGIGQKTEVTFDTWTVGVGEWEMTLTTDLEGDEFPDNDMQTATATAIGFVPTKRVLGEEGTGTWCGWCVRGIVAMEHMAETYPETWIGIAAHVSDPMEIDVYSAAVGNLINNSYPGGSVDRKVFVDPSTFEPAYEQQIVAIPAAGVEIESVSYNPNTGDLSFTANAQFIADVSNYRFSALIIENGVTGTDSGYDQTNSYAGGAAGEMGGFENLPNPIPAADMVYNDVARILIGDFEGIDGSLPTTCEMGESYSYEFQTNISNEWDDTELKIVVMLIDATTGFIDNANFTTDIITAVSNIDKINNIKMYPNPTQDKVTLSNLDDANVLIYNMNGALMGEWKHINHKITINTNNYTNGTYLVKVISNNTVLTTKLNIVK